MSTSLPENDGFEDRSLTVLQKDVIDQLVERMNEAEPIDLRSMVDQKSLEDIQMKCNDGMDVYGDLVDVQVSAMINMIEKELQRNKKIPSGTMHQYMYQTREWFQMRDAVMDLNSKTEALKLAFLAYCKIDELESV